MALFFIQVFTLSVWWAAEKQQNSIYNDSWWNYGKLLRHSQIVLGDIHVPSMYECLPDLPIPSIHHEKTWIEVEDEVEEARLLTMYTRIHDDASRPPIPFNFNMMSSRLMVFANILSVEF